MNAIGEGTRSDSLFFETLPTISDIMVRPEAPQQFRVTATTQNSIVVAWSPVDDQNGLPINVYSIYYAPYNTMTGEFGVL